jgi:hypothetical protein
MKCIKIKTINICNKDGHTARDIAVEKHYVDIKNILLNAIENTNAHDACTEQTKC